MSSESSRRLFQGLCSLKKPSDITPGLLQQTNLAVTTDATFDDHIPGKNQFKNVAPSGAPNHASSQQQQEKVKKSLEELRMPAAAAFREVVRLPPLPDAPRVRLVHTRKFWTGLEKMSQYWDASVDQYYSIPEDKIAKAKTSGQNGEDAKISALEDSSAPLASTTGGRTERYKGRRLGNGASMPSSYREDTVASLVELVVWAYNCQVRARYLPSMLAVRNLLFPVRPSSFVGRVPQEREMARKGMLEGPIMGIYCRSEHTFSSADHSNETIGSQTKSKPEFGSSGIGWQDLADLSREIAVMLLLAQERAREGKTEEQPGEGKWWTSKPRQPTRARPEEPPTREAGGEKVCLGGTAPAVSAPRSGGPTANGDIDTNPAGDNCATKNSRLGVASTATRRTSGSKTTSESSLEPDDDNGKENCHRGSRSKKGAPPKPPLNGWDRRMKYMKIGAPSQRTAISTASKMPSHVALASNTASSPISLPSLQNQPTNQPSQGDQIFLVSSLNHHVALLSMSISSTYLDWLCGKDVENRNNDDEPKEHLAEATINDTHLNRKDDGDLEEDTMMNDRHQNQDREPIPSSNRLCLKRTRWFDLFSEDDRVEFVEGLAMVMDWMMRQPESEMKPVT